MKKWNEFNWLQKLLIGAAILVVALLTPELMLLVDLGGIDLAFGVLILYYRPFLAWITNIAKQIKEDAIFIKVIMERSMLAKPKIFAANVIYSALFLFVTGSFVASFSLLLPALMIPGALV